jgi:DNA-binding transcriptional LysR family regulator
MAHTPRHIEWDDLRYVLAVAEHGGLAAAARVLGVNHTTVLRRVNGFEEAHGLRLFERLPSGYALTAGGEEMLATARRMAETVAELERRLSGQDLRLEGTLRVATTDTLMASLLPGVLARFHAAHPGIVVEVAVSNLFANLTRRDADVAIRPAASPPETLVGRRVADVAFALYAAPGLAVPGDEDLGAAWIGLDDSLAGSTIAAWMRNALPEARIVLRCDTLVGAAAAAAAGLGVAALPCYLGDGWPGLRRIAGPVPEMTTALWVLTHEDLRRTARVSAFTEFAAEAFAARRALFEGREPAAAWQDQALAAPDLPKPMGQRDTEPAAWQDPDYAPHGTMRSGIRGSAGGSNTAR